MANRQETVCNYIYENYVQFERLRHDVISNKVQINDEMSAASPLNDEMMQAARWRDITTSDINDIVCDCSAESGLQITSREVLAVLQSHRIPDVHPLREYVLNCPPYDETKPVDWIGWLSEQVTVAYFDLPAADSGQFMTTAEISDKLVSWGNIKRPMSMVQLGMLLKKNGYQSKQVGVARTRGWLVRERTLEEVNANRNIEGRT